MICPCGIHRGHILHCLWKALVEVEMVVVGYDGGPD